MSDHSHRFTIADEQTVQFYLGKLSGWSPRQARREKLLRALNCAAARYKCATQQEDRAFFHGLLTGYAVALKLM